MSTFAAKPVALRRQGMRINKSYKRVSTKEIIKAQAKNVEMFDNIICWVYTFAIMKVGWIIFLN